MSRYIPIRRTVFTREEWSYTFAHESLFELSKLELAIFRDFVALAGY